LKLNSKLCQLIDNLPIIFAKWSVENRDSFFEAIANSSLKIMENFNQNHLNVIEALNNFASLLTILPILSDMQDNYQKFTNLIFQLPTASCLWDKLEPLLTTSFFTIWNESFENILMENFQETNQKLLEFSQNTETDYAPFLQIYSPH
jgi:hypothetical protein